jgi:predicted AAA+ superfamily ATPase
MTINAQPQKPLTHNCKCMQNFGLYLQYFYYNQNNYLQMVTFELFIVLNIE